MVLKSLANEMLDYLDGDKELEILLKSRQFITKKEANDCVKTAIVNLGRRRKYPVDTAQLSTFKNNWKTFMESSKAEIHFQKQQLGLDIQLEHISELRCRTVARRSFNESEIASTSNTTPSSGVLEITSSQESQVSQESIDYHPLRTCEYYFIDQPENYQQQQGHQHQENDWIINQQYNISQKCCGFKENTKAMKSNPASLSDTRLLALNDIYKFTENIDTSVTRYFGHDVHSAIMSIWDMKPHLPEGPINAFIWCSKITIDPPKDFMACLALCAGYMTQAASSKNQVDCHTVHAFSQLLPTLINGSFDKSIEDSYVHHCLGPILQSVFGSDATLKTRWANGNDIKQHNSVSRKPDFVVYTKSINIKCVVLIAEFKPTENNSAVESDELKLARQMKASYNDLVNHKIANPIICGILAQGKRVTNYIMDMISPKLYRFRKISQVDLCFELQEVNLIPTIIMRLLQLKSIMLETAKKAEDTIIEDAQTRQRSSSTPLKAWLSSDDYILARKRKKSSDKESLSSM